MDLKFNQISIGRLLLLLALTSLPVVNSLEAVEVAYFPTGIFSITPYYDGHSDTIYLFGGQKNIFEYTPNYDIFSFSSTNHTLEKIGEIPSNVEIQNNVNVFSSSNGSQLIYLVNTPLQNRTLVFEFNPIDGTSIQIGEIQLGLDLSPFSQAPNGDIYVLGGYYFPETILRLNLESDPISSEVVGSLGVSLEPTVCAKVGNTKAFLFGATYENPDQFRYIVFDLDTLELSGAKFLATTFDTVPMVTATNRDEIMLIGGYTEASIKRGMIQLNTTTNVETFLPVDGFPLFLGGYYFVGPSPVYVEKLNRIYFFGGLQVPVVHEKRICNIPAAVNSLEAVQVANFLARLFLTTPYYDENSDTIFVFGGEKDLFQDSPSYDIFAFSTTNHNLTKINEIPSSVKLDGRVSVFPKSNSSDLLYIVSRDYENITEVCQFHTVGGSSFKIGEIQIGLDSSAFSKAPNGDLLVLGTKESPDEILKLDLESETINAEVIGLLRKNLILKRSVKVGNEEYIIGDAGGVNVPYSFIRLDLESLESTGEEVELPISVGVPYATGTNRDEVLLVGGQPRRGLIQINTTTQAVDFLPVDNFPVFEQDYYIVGPSVAYVEKLNRVYFFGGVIFPVIPDNRIWYVDLDERP